MNTVTNQPVIVKLHRVGNLYFWSAGDYSTYEFYATPLAALDAAALLCHGNAMVTLPKAWHPALVELWTSQGVTAAIFGLTEWLWNVVQRRAYWNHLNETASVLQGADAVLSHGVGLDWNALELATVIDGVAL